MHAAACAWSFLDRMDSDDTGMVQRSEGPGFALKPREPLGLARDFGRHDFQDHLASEPGIRRRYA